MDPNFDAIFSIIKKGKLNKPLKSLLADLADGTDLRRPLPSAEVAADSTPPHGHGELEGNFCDIST